MTVGEALRAAAREEARREVASLCGLVLRRLQDAESLREADTPVQIRDLARIFGEALRDFGATESEPGK